MHSYQELAAATAIYPPMSAYPFFGLAGETGEVLELAKKALRDDHGEWSDERLLRLKMELGDVLWYIAAICRDYGLTMDGVAKANLDKLASRQARGVLAGSGDDR
jgi:NTP pyrophosphatase (non-canonical NTP hydrolase)